MNFGDGFVFYFLFYKFFVFWDGNVNAIVLIKWVKCVRNWLKFLKIYG